MNHPHLPSLLTAPWLHSPCLRAGRGLRGRSGYTLLPPLCIVSLVWACCLSQPADLERTQADNMRLTKALHAHLNRHDWPAVERLCAETVRYRGRATQFAEVDEPRAAFLTHYRRTLTSKLPGSLEIRQLYPAGAYHVIAEGIAAGEPPDSPLPVCLIYTIEDNHITRLYAY